MGDFDIYEDLRLIDETEDSQWKEKYHTALFTIEKLEAEKKDLNKKIKVIEINFASLLDTARAEIKRKDKQIAELRKEKDDLCFRRDARLREKWPVRDGLLPVAEKENSFSKRLDISNSNKETESVIFGCDLLNEGKNTNNRTENVNNTKDFDSKQFVSAQEKPIQYKNVIGDEVLNDIMQFKEIKQYFGKKDSESEEFEFKSSNDKSNSFFDALFEDLPINSKHGVPDLESETKQISAASNKNVSNGNVKNMQPTTQGHRKTPTIELCDIVGDYPCSTVPSTKKYNNGENSIVSEIGLKRSSKMKFGKLDSEFYSKNEKKKGANKFTFSKTYSVSSNPNGNDAIQDSRVYGNRSKSNKNKSNLHGYIKQSYLELDCCVITSKNDSSGKDNKNELTALKHECNLPAKDEENNCLIKNSIDLSVPLSLDIKEKLRTCKKARLGRNEETSINEHKHNVFQMNKMNYHYSSTSGVDKLQEKIVEDAGAEHHKTFQKNYPRVNELEYKINPFNETSKSSIVNVNPGSHKSYTPNSKSVFSNMFPKENVLRVRTIKNDINNPLKKESINADERKWIAKINESNENNSRLSVKNYNLKDSTQTNIKSNDSGIQHLETYSENQHLYKMNNNCKKIKEMDANVKIAIPSLLVEEEQFSPKIKNNDIFIEPILISMQTNFKSEKKIHHKKRILQNSKFTEYDDNVNLNGMDVAKYESNKGITTNSSNGDKEQTFSLVPLIPIIKDVYEKDIIDFVEICDSKKRYKKKILQQYEYSNKVVENTFQYTSFNGDVATLLTQVSDNNSNSTSLENRMAKNINNLEITNDDYGSTSEKLDLGTTGSKELTARVCEDNFLKKIDTSKRIEEQQLLSVPDTQVLKSHSNKASKRDEQHNNARISDVLTLPFMNSKTSDIVSNVGKFNLVVATEHISNHSFHSQERYLIVESPKNSKEGFDQNFLTNIDGSNNVGCIGDCGNLCGTEEHQHLKQKLSSDFFKETEEERALDKTIEGSNVTELINCNRVHQKLFSNDHSLNGRHLLPICNENEDIQYQEIDNRLRSLFQSPNYNVNKAMQNMCEHIYSPRRNEKIMRYHKVSNRSEKSECDTSSLPRIVSVGANDYVIETVASNVANVFVTRKKCKKRKKITMD